LSLRALWRRQRPRRLPQQKHLARNYAETFAATAELHLPPHRLLKQLRTTTATTMGTTTTKTK
jgi:hypothetical protein